MGWYIKHWLSKGQWLHKTQIPALEESVCLETTIELILGMHLNQPNIYQPSIYISNLCSYWVIIYLIVCQYYAVDKKRQPNKMSHYVREVSTELDVHLNNEWLLRDSASINTDLSVDGENTTHYTEWQMAPCLLLYCSAYILSWYS